MGGQFAHIQKKEIEMSNAGSPMTTEEYAVQYEGELCPLCRSENIRASKNVQVYQDTIYRSVECVTCGAVWEEELRPVSYHNLRERVITLIKVEVPLE